jgi:hypothetical protein
MQRGIYSEAYTMQITDSLNKKIYKAVQVSMQIEGYNPSQAPSIKAKVEVLMKQHRVQISVQRK